MNEYLDVITDPHHVVAELFWTAVFDGLIGAVLWPLIKRAVRRHDEKEHSDPWAHDPQPNEDGTAVEWRSR